MQRNSPFFELLHINTASSFKSKGWIQPSPTRLAVWKKPAVRHHGVGMHMKVFDSGVELSWPGGVG
jgi:hypothetical protein